MKKSLFTSLFIVLIYSGYSFNTLNAISTTIPVTKTKKKAKTKEHCFEHSNPYKKSSLCRLIQMGNYKAVKDCIEKGANINKISLKLTPLMYAARHNKADILKLLIKEGANLKAKSCNGFTALTWAKHSGAKEAYQILKEALYS